MQLFYKLGAFALAAIFLVGSCALLVKLGKMQGAAEVQLKWDKDARTRQKAIDTLQGEYLVLQQQHATQVEELTHELQASALEFQTTLDGYRTDYANRLQLSTNRANVYQRQANGSAIERDRLAKHAAELDRSLEEGRSLVRELRETLGQRDATIRSLGKLIIIDRNLLENKHGNQ